MPDYFRAVAVDFDGTLTSGGRPSESVLDAVSWTRAAGRRVVLVTGRILVELRQDFPDVDQWFDAIVAENGAVTIGPDGHLRTSPAVDTRVQRALEAQGHKVRAGLAVLACMADAGQDAFREIKRLGLSYQLVYNRSELMILPAGVSKGTGLVEAMTDLGLSTHSAIGIGDAENDHALLAQCEVGVAVANAVDALKERADIVLNRPNGLGVAEFLRGPVLGGQRRIHPRRWQLHLGVTERGDSVTIPASQVNVLITGASRSGKSYLSGILAEQLIELGYSVVLVDPEGDHTSLGQMPGVVVVGGTQTPPDVEHLAQLIGPVRGSAVVDLSQLSGEAKESYYRAAPLRLSQLRAHTGLPHWVFFDEAHVPLAEEGPGHAWYEPLRKGHCLVTYQPASLCSEAIEGLDILIVMLSDPKQLASSDEPDPVLDALEAFTGLSRKELSTCLTNAPGATAVLVRHESPHDLVPFTPRDRRTKHVRHWHSYTQGLLEWRRRFFFYRAEHQPTGAVAANLTQFRRELTACEPEVVLHHLRRGDFSGWIESVLRDDILARQFRGIEQARQASNDPEKARAEFVAALEERYLPESLRALQR